MPRRVTPELMDDPGVPPAKLGEALSYIRAVNRRLGGVEALLRHLRDWSARWTAGHAVTLLDVGTGSADLPIAARRWAAEHGFALAVTAIDRHEETLRFAREQADADERASASLGLSVLPPPPAIRLHRIDALDLDAAYPPASFDYVHAGLFLHHLSDADARRVLASMWRIARRGIVWNDLVRSRIGHAFIWAATLGRGRMIRHDATVSVLAGFSRNEAVALAERAGVPRGLIRHRWSLFTHRFTLTAEKPEGEAPEPKPAPATEPIA